MSDDPDFPKASHALLVLRQARLSRNEAAATMVHDLACARTGNQLNSTRMFIVLSDCHVTPRPDPPKNAGLELDEAGLTRYLLSIDYRKPST
jgi:hypothetical protein